MHGISKMAVEIWLMDIKESKNCLSIFRLGEHKQTSRVSCKTRYAGVSWMYLQTLWSHHRLC